VAERVEAELAKRVQAIYEQLILSRRRMFGRSSEAQAGCHLPAYRSQSVSGIKEPGRFRHIGAASFSAYRSHAVSGI
jgi:hypothetical protein